MRTGTPAAPRPDPTDPIERRAEDVGPPPGVPERREQALKMKCPFCAASASRVRRSRGVIVVDAVRRTRVCVDCGETFPTKEEIDWDSLKRRRRRPSTAA